MEYRDVKARLREVALRRPGRAARARTTWWSARAPAARPRSTCGPATSPTWGWPGRRAAGDRRRRHRPGRGVRRAVRHAGAAGAGGPGAGRRLRGQQVPRRRRSCWSPAWTARGADRPPGVRRAALAGRAVARRRGLPRPGRGRAQRRPRLGGDAAGRGRAAAADLQLHRRRRAGRRTRRARCRFATTPGASSPTPTWSCCPAPAPPSPTWPGCATRGLAAAMPSARARAAGARHLRRLPDARPGRSCDDVESGAGAVRGPGPAAGAGGRSPRRRCWAGPSGAAYGRSGRTAYEIHHGVVAAERRRAVSWTAAATARCGARRGTARWRTTRFRRAFLDRRGAPAAAAIHARRRTPASPRCGRRGSTPSATWSRTIWTPRP